MKKVVLILAATIGMTAIASVANADTEATAIVNASLPVLNSVSSNGGNTSSNISVDNGQLSSTLAPKFQAFTNNNSGVLVQFQVRATDSSNSSVDAIKGTNNSNTGTLALANTDVRPTQGSINDALNNNPSVDQNANTIAYKVTLSGSQNGQRYIPVFDSNGTSASVTAPSGTTDFTVEISNDNSLLTNSYSSDYDLAGAYQATIYCTVSNP